MCVLLWQSAIARSELRIKNMAMLVGHKYPLKSVPWGTCVVYVIFFNYIQNALCCVRKIRF